MKKIIISLTILTFSLIYSFFNLGIYLDVTKKPSKTDLIVCLGGERNKIRTKKTIELSKNIFSDNKYIIFTSVKIIDKDTFNSIDKNINIIADYKAKNTMEEVLFIKDFIKENHLSSVIFITEAPHSRRVKFFWDTFGEELNNISFSVVASDLSSWNSSNYYENNSSLKYALSELTKLIYNSILYGLFEKLGFKEEFELNYKKELKEIRKKISIN